MGMMAGFLASPFSAKSFNGALDMIGVDMGDDERREALAGPLGVPASVV